MGRMSVFTSCSDISSTVFIKWKGTEEVFYGY